MDQTMLDLSARLFVMGGLIVFFLTTNPFLLLQYDIDKVVNTFLFGIVLMLAGLYIVFVCIFFLIETGGI